MKVKELIAYLKLFPQNADVYLSSDAEGNSFANVHEVGATDETHMKAIIWPMHERLEEVV